jgi:hypothetical protein
MTAAIGPQPGGGGQGRNGGGILGNPGLLAAGAAGFASAVLAIWAFRGLPLGTPMMWLAPLPLFLAGLGFGAASAGLAALLASVLVWLLSVGMLPVLAYVALFGAPAPLMVVGALRGVAAGGGQLGLAGPLVVLGTWPVVVLLLAAFAMGDEPGGLDAALRRGIEAALDRMGVAAGEAFIGTLVKVKAAAIGFWSSLALVGSGVLAQALLTRWRLARAATPCWSTAARLPRWYPALPAVTAAAVLMIPGGGGAVPLSALLMLLVPLFLLGLAGVHARAMGRRGRVPMLAGFYLLLLLFLQLMAPALVGLGLFDHFRRRGGGAAPTQT